MSMLLDVLCLTSCMDATGWMPLLGFGLHVLRCPAICCIAVLHLLVGVAGPSVTHPVLPSYSDALVPVIAPVPMRPVIVLRCDLAWHAGSGSAPSNPLSSSP